MRNLIILLSLALTVSACGVVPLNKEIAEADIDIPPIPREFRAAWVATVANIDWPSKPGLPVEEQKAEVIAILDKAVEINLNAIVLQVRPQCDALYDSKLEPWSYFLMGKMGKAPEPYYDPLEFWVEESHKRGIELHTWFNPYRANHPSMKSEISENSIIKTRPDLVKKLGNQGYYWMDPAIKEVQDISAAVIADVVKRYDIDGFHFDDYFYPYRDYNDNKDFPDDDTWEAYQKSGGKLSRDDWRRDAVNTFIKRVYDETKKSKPHVKFGISPFGIWRPGYPPEVAMNAFDQYSVLYADAKLWLEKGWVDYWTPQIYWEISNERVPYKPILRWWTEQNKENRNIWVGNYTSKYQPEEIINQIKATRDQPGASGNVHFSMKPLLENRNDLSKKLKEQVYQEQALVPASPWLSNDPFLLKPALDIIKGRDGSIALEYSLDSPSPVWQWVIYKKIDGAWKWTILPGGMKRCVIEPAEAAKLEAVGVSAVDRVNQESKRIAYFINK